MKILWIIYAIIGLIAFLISFLMEGSVFSNISGNILISYLLAAVFESAKITTIVMHRFQTEKNKNKIPLSFEGGVAVFKLILFLVSILCSVTLLATFLDKPNLNKIMLTEKEIIENNYQESKKIILAEHDKAMKNLDTEVQSKYPNRYSRLAAYYEPRIEREEKLRDFEFNNIINNVRKGIQWNEHDRKIKLLTNDYQKKEAELKIEETEELTSRQESLKRDFFSKLNELHIKKNDSLANLQQHLNDDSRVSNQMILSLIATLKKGLDIKISYYFVIILLAVIIAILLEGTILIVFNFITITHMEIFSMKHDQYVEVEKIKTNAKNEIQKDNFKYEVFKNRVKNQVHNMQDNVLNF